MNLRELEQQLTTTQQKLEELRQGNSSQASCHSLAYIEALTQSYEELQLTLEELQQQNEELCAAHAEIEAERQQYKELFEFAPEAYLVTNASGLIEEANQRAVTLFAVKEVDFLLSRPLRIFVAPQRRQDFSQCLRQLPQSSQQIFTWEFPLLARQQNQAFPAELSVCAVRDLRRNRLAGYRWIIRDLSERKQAERVRQELATEREFSELKSRFLETVSHEYRTPLNTIHTAAQLLGRQWSRLDCAQAQWFLNRIQGSVEYMNQLLEKILVLKQTEMHVPQVQPTLFDLELFCQDLLADHRFAADDSAPERIHFVSRCQQSTSVCSDARLLRYVLGNLLSNALKYSPPDSRIDFILTFENNQASFEIRDFGCGIVPEDLPYLFSPFYRGHNTGNTSGTGLGLAIAKRALDSLNGEIAIESKVGAGTTVTVKIPMNQTLRRKAPPPEQSVSDAVG